MRAALLDTTSVTAETAHCAFTSLCHWRGRYWLAYRRAMTHGIIPPGGIEVRSSGQGARWSYEHTIDMPQADLRDPRLVATEDLLFLLCGAYLPSPHVQYAHGLGSRSSDNQIWTFYTYTRDGDTWSPLQPLLRPNAWGWSAETTQRGWTLASYEVGALETCNTVTLWSGTPLTGFRHTGIIYDVGSIERERGRYRYMAMLPSEPVLYRPAPDTLACCVRTEGSMLLGVGHMDRTWRWEDTGLLLHPSCLLHTKHGLVLAARELTPVYTRGKVRKVERYEASVTLWQVKGNRFRRLLTLEGGGDCAYSGLCEGTEPGEVLVSYYASDKAPVPCADVFVARVRLET